LCHTTDEECPFREGVVVARPVKAGGASWVNIGLTKDCQIDRVLPAGTRVTVRLTSSLKAKVLTGVAVSPDTPREEAGLYWGYQTRLAAGLSHVWSECAYAGGM
jgi:predicted SPOUT superfamily RNA methylase MTH1